MIVEPTGIERAAYIIIGLIVGVVLHEYMHGKIADMRGDHTARIAGRLTLNPIAHLDPFGSFLLPASLLLFSGGRIAFGYAKPVPVNPFFLKRKKDMMLVALAGPMTNLLIASAFTLTGAVIHIAGVEWGSWHGYQYEVLPLFWLLYYGMMINVWLALFNLIPIPPLDGSHIVEAFLSHEQRMYYDQIAPYGFIFLFAIIYGFSGIFDAILNPIFDFALRVMGW